MEVSGTENDICSCKHPGKSRGSYQSILGVVKVDKGIHHWKFKILKYGSEMANWKLVIGITKIDKLSDAQINNLLDNYISCNKASYALVAYSGSNNSFLVSQDLAGNSYRDYGEVCKNVGDVIDMYLDLDNLVLRFGINGKVYVILMMKSRKQPIKWL